ncbi:deoxyribose-phosphate aldolase [Alkalicoccus saliphilus]|jgi:deoxyribose-phosphate aldolase|uniref:Deoxyribose-phosphate aldolase n=1 Tax=Alkalicoccus saliphilus TaxID=200989 RepID=A0A2T4U798_9BACI|nr:deoxyribose-phosphate aldolase [Alkalicoccus saliphilus]PTL39235.1 deoxyribose-phosphate aldolase [Alkalicoccus saliphilus]
MTKSAASIIDHTLLKPETTKEQVLELCREAAEYGFASVCVNPTWVKTCAEELKNSNAKVCTVIGFPLGANTPEVKAFETKDAIKNGAEEVDMVLNIGALKDGSLELVEQDMRAVQEAAEGKALTKVILETCLLTDDEKRTACSIAVKAGLDFVKTSTGFSFGAATVEDVKLMREAVGDKAGVKASGGVKTKEDAQAMIDAGATRIGASAGVAIVKGEESSSDY